MQRNFGLQGKIIELGLALERFELDEHTWAGQDVIGLRPGRVGRGALERGVLTRNSAIGLSSKQYSLRVSALAPVR